MMELPLNTLPAWRPVSCPLLPLPAYSAPPSAWPLPLDLVMELFVNVLPAIVSVAVCGEGQKKRMVTAPPNTSTAVVATVFPEKVELVIESGRVNGQVPALPSSIASAPALATPLVLWLPRKRSEST